MSSSRVAARPPDGGVTIRRASPATRTWWLIAALTALAVLSTALVLGLAPGLDLEAVLLLSALGVASVSLPTTRSQGHVGASLTPTLQIAALPIAGPAAGALVGGVTYLLLLRRTRQSSRLFNAAMNGLMGGVSGLIYVGVGGRYGAAAFDRPVDLLLHLGLPLTLAYVASAVVNVLIMNLRLGWYQPAARRAFLAAALPEIRAQLPVAVLLAFLFATLWGPGQLEVMAAVLVLGPLAVAHLTLVQDAAERTSHERTVKTLVATLETANPYAVGHSSRVAELCRRMGEELVLPGSDRETLTFAALLHDIGLITASPSPRRPPSEVGVDYLAQITQHPGAGVAVLEDIVFLRPALPAIRHHHERWDGLGYPSGLRGEQIPRLARIIAVADAFDSLTCHRGYREALGDQEACALLRTRAETHLDPDVVEALARVLERRPWAPTTIVLADETQVLDHDDPMISDRYAEWAPDGDDEHGPDLVLGAERAASAGPGGPDGAEGGAGS